jgi:hypothetical protein
MQQDKALHFAVGLAVGVAAALVIHQSAGIPAAMLVGWLKERRDKQRPDAHTYDGWDAFATAVGAVPSLAVPYLVTALSQLGR